MAVLHDTLLLSVPTRMSNPGVCPERDTCHYFQNSEPPQTGAVAAKPNTAATFQSFDVCSSERCESCSLFCAQWRVPVKRSKGFTVPFRHWWRLRRRQPSTTLQHMCRQSRNQTFTLSIGGRPPCHCTAGPIISRFPWKQLHPKPLGMSGSGQDWTAVCLGGRPARINFLFVIFFPQSSPPGRFPGGKHFVHEKTLSLSLSLCWFLSRFSSCSLFGPVCCQSSGLSAVCSRDVLQ